MAVQIAARMESVVTLLAMLLRAARRWKAYRWTVAELSLLDDRGLADLNIRRDDIARIAREAARHAA